MPQNKGYLFQSESMESNLPKIQVCDIIRGIYDCLAKNTQVVSSEKDATKIFLISALLFT